MKNTHAPGLRARGRRNAFAWYWIAPKKDIAAGYAPKSITLDPSATAEERAAKCRVMQADLEAWRRGEVKTPNKHTITWLIWRYRTDALSPYHGVKEKTRSSYDAMCKIIEKTVGERRLDPILEGGVLRPRIIGQDVRRWHSQWGKPDPDGKPTAPSRARHLITVLRILSSYGVEIAVPGAKDLRELLSAIRFAVTPAREAAPDRAQVLAIVKTALEMGQRSIAITTLAQFEFTERRINIIGEWNAGQWSNGWRWQDIRDWTIDYKQTKIGKNARSFDLRETPALLELLQQTPEERRIGPVIVKDSTGEPWRYRDYINAFRKVATAAGLPDVWSMDMRAGGATEAGKIAGIGSFDIQAAGGWSDAKMASRYTRDRIGRAQNVVRLRQAKAKSE